MTSAPAPGRFRVPDRVRVAAPWVWVVATVATFAWSAIRQAQLGDASGAAAGWRPEDAPEAIDPGVLGLPVTLALLVIAPLAVGALVNRHLRPALDERIRGARARRVIGSPWIRITWVATWLLYVGLFSFGPLGPGRDPLVTGTAMAPGPAVREVRPGAGSGVDEALDEQSSFEVPFSCNGSICPAPLYVAPLRPGEVVTYLVGVRNMGPIGITILGPSGAVRIGLPRDPTHPSADPAQVVPFHPVSVPAGGEVALVLARVANACADPDAPVGPADRSRAFGFSVEYDALGHWRRATIWPPLEVTIPGEDRCAEG